MRLDIAALKAKREELSDRFDRTAGEANDLLKDTKKSLGVLEDGIQENQQIINEWNSAIGKNRA